ncbi:dephospho-CoA kinase [Methylophilaceae bacterium 11]|nr:dephospho-CoA kinase [Methylophilaceae bacterium 11]
MKTVALTGGIGSGKSIATQMLSSLGVPIVDLDVIAHTLTAAGGALVPQIATEFGSEFITEEGALNRPLMRALIFTQPDARVKLNAIMHPAIFDEAVKQLAALVTSTYVVLAIPLLQESQRYLPYIDHVLVIDCDESLQLARVMERSGLSAQEAQQIIDAQSSRQSRIAMADTIITNDAGLAEFEENIYQFHKNYINTCIVSK